MSARTLLPLPLAKWVCVGGGGMVVCGMGETPGGPGLDGFPLPHPPTSLLLIFQGGEELFVFPVALIYGPLCSLSICTNSVK